MIWLDNARIASIIAVIFIHSSMFVIIGSEVGTDYWWIGNFYDSFSRWSVPVFIMLSGALLLNPKDNENFTVFYQKRFSKILIPIIFWSIFFLVWTNLKELLKGNQSTFSELLSPLLNGRPYYHMWFMYMILMLYLFTPFFRQIIKQSSRQQIWFFVIVSCLLSIKYVGEVKFFTDDSHSNLNSFLLYIPYFFLGYLIRIDERQFSKNILYAIFIISSLLTAYGFYYLSMIKGVDAGLYFYEYTSITVIPMSVSIIYLMKYWSKPIGNPTLTRKLSLLTLGVYLIHPIVIDIIRYFSLGPMNYNPIVSIPIFALIVFLSSIITSWVISHIPYIKRII